MIILIPDALFRKLRKYVSLDIAIAYSPNYILYLIFEYTATLVPESGRCCHFGPESSETKKNSLIV